jgi:hypothetical protein
VDDEKALRVELREPATEKISEATVFQFILIEKALLISSNSYMSYFGMNVH